MQRIKRIGDGTYSRVYSAVTPHKGTKIAVKRCITSRQFDFCVGMRELQINKLLGDHPNVIKLYRVADGNPFSDGLMSPLTDECYYRDDKIHLIYPLADCNLHQYQENLPEKRFPPALLQKIAVQLLLAVEYMHARGFLHRDIKTENVLMMGETPKLADFGLAKPMNTFDLQTPEVVTLWYRAPEICFRYPHYTDRADVWSVGCVIYEMLTGSPLSGRICRNSDLLVLTGILSQLPYGVLLSTLTFLDHSPDRELSRKIRTRPIRNSMDSFLRLTPSLERGLDEHGGCSNFIETLMGLLQFDFRQRWSATQALDSAYFEPYREFIRQTREQHPPVKLPSPMLTVESCQERRWMCNMANTYYHHRQKFESWYHHRRLFQAISIFDRVLCHLAAQADPNVVPSDYRGRVLTREQTELYFVACIYMSIKYFSTKDMAIPFAYIAHAKYRTPEHMARVDQFEMTIIRDILQMELYQETPLDVLLSHHPPTEEEVYSLLVMVLSGHHHGHTAQEFFELWYNKNNENIKSSC